MNQNNTEYYPLILFPYELEQALKAEPQIEEPLKPDLPTDPISGVLFIVFMGMFVFFSFKILYNEDSKIYILGMVLLMVWFVNSRFSLKKADEAYKRDMEAYKEKLKEHKKRLQEITNVGYVKKYRQEEIKKILKKAQSPIFHKEVIKFGNQELSADIFKKRGASEEFFKKYLKTFFGDKIFINVAMGYFVGARSYEPDFAFIDEASNLHIDIEIDEEYSIIDNKPIHYIGIDTKRDSYFISNLWIVIRFAEKQVLEQPESCCKEIAKVIDFLISDSSYLEKLSRYDDVKPTKRWTYEEALQAIKDKERDKRKYLL